MRRHAYGRIGSLSVQLGVPGMAVFSPLLSASMGHANGQGWHAQADALVGHRPYSNDIKQPGRTIAALCDRG